MVSHCRSIGSVPSSSEGDRTVSLGVFHDPYRTSGDGRGRALTNLAHFDFSRIGSTNDFPAGGIGNQLPGGL